MSKQVRRLYEQFQPEHYDLSLKLDRDNMRFSGTVAVRGKKVGRPSQRLTFHQKGLKITAGKIVKRDKKGDLELPVNRINNQNTLNEVRLHSREMIYPSEYIVTLEFNGRITAEMNGIYPCPFKHEGQDKSLIATQFESHYARKAFPCIDEPEAKATFDLTLETPGKETVLSNTPIKQQKTTGQNQVTSFETTPRMSTYLLAFVAGEMHRKSTRTKNGTEVNAWATIAQPIDSLDFATDVAKGCIEFFEDYFGVAYPLAKSDHVALPDFAVGAMENWGLITYRERLLVAYPGETSQTVREFIALVIAHETSHQWFGDLTTMRWWDDLWLNESFANMMEYQAVDTLFPAWHVWDTFINHEGLSALRRDATPGVQAVKVAVNHPDEISTLFDHSIVYAKGGRLLYMLKNYIGEEAFRNGLSQYFKQHAYKNTTGDDLWAALSTASGLDIGEFMNPWLERSGFPVVSVDQTAKAVTLEQEHFLENPDKADPKRIWPVPLFANDQNAPRLLKKKQTKFNAADREPVLINQGAIGHYIPYYKTKASQDSLLAAVQAGSFSDAERLMLLNDASMLSRANYQPYGDVLNLLRAYTDESSEPVWSMMALILVEARRFIDLDEQLENSIKSFIRALISHEHKRLGWNEKKDEPVSDTKLRAIIIGLGAYAEEPNIVSKGKKLFASYQQKPSAISNELRSTVFGIAIKQKVTGAFDYLLKLHDATDNSDLKSDIAAALTITHSIPEAQKLLSRLTNSKLVKAQDADRWLVYLLRNRHTREVAWQWMEDNWQWVEETYKDEATYDHWPRYAAAVCNTKQWEDRYKHFFKAKTDQLGLKRNIEVGIEEIDTRVKWLERDLSSVQKFFK